MSKKIPVGALCLAEAGSQATFLAEGEGGEKKKLNMLAYSGKTIKGHWWWGDLTLDCSGVRLAAKTFPILESHDVDRKIAFSSAPIVGDDGVRINPDKTSFVSTPESKSFQELAAEGFPYQSSVRAKPLKVERIEEGEKAEVNGFTVRGPHTIFRDWEMSEASVCVFGWDNKTHASAFSNEVELEYDLVEHELDEEEDFNNEGKGGEEVMDLKELMEKYPNLVDQIKQDTLKEAEAKFAKEREGFQTQLSTMNTELEKRDDRILKLEKQETLRTERELQLEADRIWDTKLAQSDIEPRLYEKVRVHVKHSKFTQDGVFDKEKFSEAVAAEIQDWETRGATQTVLGQGSRTREETTVSKEEELEEKESDEASKRLLARAGQKVDNDK